jgi:hypothetical protein
VVAEVDNKRSQTGFKSGLKGNISIPVLEGLVSEKLQRDLYEDGAVECGLWTLCWYKEHVLEDILDLERPLKKLDSVKEWHNWEKSVSILVCVG